MTTTSSASRANNVVLHLRGGETGVVYGPIGEPAFEQALLQILRDGKIVRGVHGRLRLRSRDGERNTGGRERQPRLLARRARTARIIYGDKYFLQGAFGARIRQASTAKVEIGSCVGRAIRQYAAARSGGSITSAAQEKNARWASCSASSAADKTRGNVID